MHDLILQCSHGDEEDLPVNRCDLFSWICLIHVYRHLSQRPSPPPLVAMNSKLPLFFVQRKNVFYLCWTGCCSVSLGDLDLCYVGWWFPPFLFSNRFLSPEMGNAIKLNSKIEKTFLSFVVQIRCCRRECLPFIPNFLFLRV